MKSVYHISFICRLLHSCIRPWQTPDFRECHESRRFDPASSGLYDFVPMTRNGKSGRKTELLLKLREAALELGISFPTIKQWIYKKKIRSIKTAGGHHRRSEE